MGHQTLVGQYHMIDLLTRQQDAVGRALLLLLLLLPLSWVPLLSRLGFVLVLILVLPSL